MIVEVLEIPLDIYKKAGFSENIERLDKHTLTLNLEKLMRKFKMKRYFLSYNSLTKDYYLDYGCFDRNREFLGKIDEQKLIYVLKKILPLQRDVFIYTQKNLEDSIKRYFIEIILKILELRLSLKRI